MKNFAKNLLLLSIIAIIFILSNTSCKKDTDCIVEIYVKSFNDTSVVIPYAGVWIHQGDNINILGTADANGKFSHTFKLEAIVNVNAMDSTLFDLSFTPPIRIYRKGEGTVRLIEGTTVKKTILIK
ncbi:MAG: hypothetical protein NTZ33_16085 [Bacteroidetes bacterium]|nr:hypothetical protein [Bacteroidota bacterium]